MTGSTFIDTNVFVYSVDERDPDKQKRAKHVLQATTDIVVSTQVMNEFYVVATRKLANPLTSDAAAAIVARMAQYNCVPTDADLVLRAIRAGQRWQVSHWDALMLTAAQQAACKRLLSEDLVDGAVYGGVKVENPFSDITPS